MIELALQDNCFYGDAGCSKHWPPKNIIWNRSSKINNISTVFFTDYLLDQVMHPMWKNKFKVAWLIEPFAINPHSYHAILANYSLFDLVLSHHQDLLDKIPNGQYYPSAMTWINEVDWKIYDKSKNMSIFASNKKITTGHQIRHQIISILKNKKILDVYGTGYNPINYKLDGLAPYRFSVAIENCAVNHYFTEKLIDCFATHTVPIYWGCPEIEKFFNPNGMVICKTMPELIQWTNKIAACGKDVYDKKLDALKENHQIAKEKYTNAEDWLYQNVLTKEENYEKNYSGSPS